MATKTMEREYEARLDSKRRIVLRKPKDADTHLYDRYLVRHRKDGVIELRPQVMADVASIPEETLRMIDTSMQHLREGVASEPVDLDKDYPNL